MTWIYAVDPGYAGAEEVPPYAITGGYPADDSGAPDGEFVPNPGYRPSPYALGLPAPANDLEAALQNAATGHGGDLAVRQALLTGTVFIAPVAPGETGETGGIGVGTPGETGDGETGDTGTGADPLTVWTSDRYLPGPDVRRDWQRIPGIELAGRALVLNPGTNLEARLPAAAMLH